MQSGVCVYKTLGIQTTHYRDLGPIITRGPEYPGAGPIPGLSHTPIYPRPHFLHKINYEKLYKVFLGAPGHSPEQNSLRKRVCF